VQTFLGRQRYERGQPFRGYRNGHHTERELTVGVGKVAVRMPRVVNAQLAITERTLRTVHYIGDEHGARAGRPGDGVPCRLQLDAGSDPAAKREAGGRVPPASIEQTPGPSKSTAGA
jgi:hypothetical protein